MASGTRDLTQGNVRSTLLSFTIPLLIGSVFQQLYNMVDAIIVGKALGDEALGAVGSVGGISFMFLSLCIGMAGGIGILAAQYFGEHNIKKVRTTIANSVYITLAIGGLMSILSIVFAKPILHLMETPEENFQYALTYMYIVCGSTVVVGLYNTVSGVMRSLGDTKTPLYFLIVSSLSNIILDLVFVYGLDWGVAGAAWATVCSQIIVTVGTVVFAYKKNPYFQLEKENWIPNKQIIVNSFQLGIPLAIQNALGGITAVLLQSLVNSFGVIAMAAYTATCKIEQLTTMAFGCMGTAIATVAGQSYGAGKMDRIHEGCKECTKFVLGYSIVIIALFFLAGKGLSGFFSSDVEVLRLGEESLRIIGLYFIFSGMIYVAKATLNGVSDTGYTMLTSIFEILCKIGCSYLFAKVFQWGYLSIWYAAAITTALSSIIGILRLRSSKWNKVHSEEREK